MAADAVLGFRTCPIGRAADVFHCSAHEHRGHYVVRHVDHHRYHYYYGPRVIIGAPPVYVTPAPVYVQPVPPVLLTPAPVLVTPGN